MAAENYRADMTFVGYFLIGMFLLVFGILGLQDAGLFGNLPTDDDPSKTLPLGWVFMTFFAFVIAVALTIYSVFMYRTGNKSATAVFMVFAASLYVYQFASIGRGIMALGDQQALVSSSWFLFVILAIVFLILTLYLLVDRAPKFLALFTMIIGVMFLFVGLAYYFVVTEDSVDIYKAMCVVFGIFSLLGFVISTYIGLAYSAPKARLPLI